ncbi:PREDICTED: GDP-D-glucose phosphorylase 1-like [Priapulus caudatus]|uniref:GDP-D-glucose phosphorylase 1 n=1 Tax=Priapulus caudatus TaxID=37621 RepID=A0ABM1E522_PRICU|nr:PREDICTED: GDP-D-glucose phosphorylase 1-like [Priapulus caudatus]
MRQYSKMSAFAVYSYCDDDYIKLVPSWSQPRVLSKFDSELRARWDQAMQDGVFKYTLDHIRTRILDGPLSLVAQLNVKRALERRKPQEISSLCQPFNPKIFNFTRISQREILFVLKRREIGEEDPLGELRKRYQDENIVIVNVSPLEYGNVLVVPSLGKCLPQILTEDAINLALETVLLSAHPGFRIGFNSLCAFASVNHLHFHAYYLEHPLYIEKTPVKKICRHCYEITEYPTRGFGFQLGENKLELARIMYKVTDYFVRENIAHNLFVTRGSAMEGDTTRQTLRAFLWPRRPVFGAKSEDLFNTAVCELAGHLPIKVGDQFDTITEAQVRNILSEASLSAVDFDKVKLKVIELLESEGQ